MSVDKSDTVFLEDRCILLDVVPMVQSEEWEYPEHEELGEHETQPQPEKVYAPEPAANSNEDAEVVIRFVPLVHTISLTLMVAYCSEARQLFALADTDESGDIDEDELVWLIQELWKELGVKLKVLSLDVARKCADVRWWCSLSTGSG